MTDREEFEKKLEADRKVYRRTKTVIIVGALMLYTLTTLYKFVW